MKIIKIKDKSTIFKKDKTFVKKIKKIDDFLFINNIKYSLISTKIKVGDDTYFILTYSINDKRYYDIEKDYIKYDTRLWFMKRKIII